jgi:DcaP outer membrane protein
MGKKYATANWRVARLLFLSALVMLVVAPAARAQTPVAPASLEIYGFGQLDAIADFKQNNPDWYDVSRPSRLPKFEDEFGRDGNFYLSARQSRFGARAVLPTASGDVKATFEFDMFGVGGDAGQTTIRLRHAYGQWKQIGAGLTNSQFMDMDVFPNTVEYWGPNGMLFFRNNQVFWEPIARADGTHLRLSIEAPGASGDAGLAADRVELQNISPRFPSPDFAGHYRSAGDWGHVQFSGIVRKMAWDDLLPDDAFDLNGSTWGWGLSVSSNLKPSDNDTLRLQVTYGEGIQNYFNDAPVDVGAERNTNNTVTPVTGRALPIFGMSAYLDHNWNSKWSTALGYSRVDIDNSDLQLANSYKVGQYVSFNLLHTPVSNVMIGGELQWADRENFSDGFTSDDFRIQFAFKYSFSKKIGG